MSEKEKEGLEGDGRGTELGRGRNKEERKMGTKRRGKRVTVKVEEVKK